MIVSNESVMRDFYSKDYMFKQCCGKCNNCWYIGNPGTCTCPDDTPKREWIKLTDKEISEISFKSQNGISPHEDTLQFARAIEAKLKEKNT